MINLFLLIAEPVDLLAVRAMPGDAVAGKMFEIQIHARLADGKPAPAGPGKRRDPAAAVAGPVACAAALPPVAGCIFSQRNSPLLHIPMDMSPFFY
jgi:hypothetical protein